MEGRGVFGADNLSYATETEIIQRSRQSSVCPSVSDGNTGFELPVFVPTLAPILPKRLRVLVVEDAVSIQKIFGRWLTNQGCEVVIAQNGLVGLEFMKTQQFDICFMDFLMVRQFTLTSTCLHLL